MRKLFVSLALAAILVVAVVGVAFAANPYASGITVATNGVVADVTEVLAIVVPIAALVMLAFIVAGLTLRGLGLLRRGR